MPKKGVKNIKGQPEGYNEMKSKRLNLSLTATGNQGLDEQAGRLGLSKSEFVEQIARGLILHFSDREGTAVKKPCNMLSPKHNKS